MPAFRVVPPSENDMFDAFKQEIFRDINCARPGVIQSIDLGTQSVTVKLTIKEWIDSTAGVSIEYPILADVPLFVIQGGGAFLELPVKEGDGCLVLFSDRDIDNWWTSGNVGATPNTLRKHSLSDGFALVGLNDKVSPLSLTGSFRLFGGSHKVDVANNLQALSALMDILFSDISDLITSIKNIVTTGSSSTQSVSTASQADLTAKAVEFSTLKGQFDQLLGS